LASPKMTKAWFKLAIRDLKTSKQLIDLGPEYKHATAYFAQQCSEKAIKGFLTSTDCRVPKTHDLEVLGKVADSVSDLKRNY
jgi:HEPN domain-containing protein